jgi:Mor family transcriptional regulator
MQLNTQDMPQSLIDVVDAIGLQPALQLVEARGGVRVYVPEPENLSRDHVLVQVLGEQNARLLAQRFGGDPLDLPRCAAALRAARNTSIRCERANGERPAAIALRHGLTERQVYSILATDPTEQNPQQSLL